jgi:hypothetical protein
MQRPDSMQQTQTPSRTKRFAARSATLCEPRLQHRALCILILGLANEDTHDYRIPFFVSLSSSHNGRNDTSIHLVMIGLALRMGRLL